MQRFITLILLCRYTWQKSEKEPKKNMLIERVFFHYPYVQIYSCFAIFRVSVSIKDEIYLKSLDCPESLILTMRFNGFYLGIIDFASSYAGFNENGFESHRFSHLSVLISICCCKC